MQRRPLAGEPTGELEVKYLHIVMSWAVSKTAVVPVLRSRRARAAEVDRAESNATSWAPPARRNHEEVGRRSVSASFSTRRGNGAHTGARPSHRPGFPCKSMFRPSAFESACGGSTPLGATRPTSAMGRTTSNGERGGSSFVGLHDIHQVEEHPDPAGGRGQARSSTRVSQASRQ
jgi:hypothetical protein